MRPIFASLLTALLFSFASAAIAQDLKGDLFPPRDNVAAGKSKTEVTSALAPTDQPGVVTLQVRLVMPEGVNTYSMDPSLPKPTKITISLPAGWAEVDPGYTPNPPPKKGFDEVFGQEMEKFYGTVTFSRRFKLPNGTNPAAAKLTGKINFLVCDKDSCVPQSAAIEAAFAPQGLKRDARTSMLEEAILNSPIQLTAGEVPAAGQVAPITAGYEVTPKRKTLDGEAPDPVRLQFELSPENAKAGETVTLAVTMTIADNWSTYGLEKADENQTEVPTSIKFQLENLEAVGGFSSVPEPELHTTKVLDEVVHSNAHEHQVTWLQKFKVLKDAPYGATGEIRYQICQTGQTCLRPLSVKFSLGSQQRAEDIADAQPIVKSFTSVTKEDKGAAFNVKSTGGDLSFAGAFVAAFLAGLIMNILPCVLPVLAIKILSLVQQAGESRTRIIALNLAYTAGVMSVFLVFAVLSWGLGNSLSSVFQNETFMIVMACVVFLMGLSLFGVFELPVPGIIPSAGHHQEGYIGAFNTGIIATVLGTPCIGPFIAPVFTWTLTQPSLVVFSIFGMMGLGMASPFLLTGFFPFLVNWLPRPGDWMVKFKQFTGFVLMGTVIWVLVSINMAWRVPVLVLLLALALLVWVNENMAFNHDPLWKKWRAHLTALVTATPIFLFGLWMLNEFHPSQDAQMQASKMPWREFSEQELVKLRDEGRPMLIDFTANWCVICKLNEKFALDRDETVKFVEENGFVPMLADFTKENPEIQKWLREFGQESVPLTIIVPPGKESEIIALRGQYTKGTLLEKLQEAAGKKAAEAKSASADNATPQLGASL
ncbi:cytochrome c biogenesis protein CcdA [Planctomicrobium sp. SH661]|uniref:protein-disulfide reductase DsbD family protein n=1 Tax=Planctomicrobium sp. SH661 TaxID=3448124 RepID=UPI003F5BDC8E